MTLRLLMTYLILTLIWGCASLSEKKVDFYDLEVEEFSSSIKLLLSDLSFLKEEILKVNAKRPSIQRILSEADSLWLKGDITEANSERWV